MWTEPRRGGLLGPPSNRGFASRDDGSRLRNPTRRWITLGFMAEPAPGSQPSPFQIFNALNAYQQTMALKGAIELELFTHIADGATPATEIARRCNAAERGVRILCDFLTVSGFLVKHGGDYGLTVESAAFLSKRSPTYIGSIAGFLAHPRHTGHFQDMAAAVRQGGSVDAGNMGPEDPVWVEFARAMAPLMRILAGIVAPMVAETGRPMKVLDIAAGHGLYGIAVAAHNPAAEIVAVDWRNVLDVAIENARHAGVASRYRTVPGSAFEVEFGQGYDVALVPAFLHHFDPSTNVRLLTKIRGSMNPGARLAILETMPNDDRVSPPSEAKFSMMMLCTTPAGDAYTFRELEQMCREAGFGKCDLRSLGDLPNRIILTHA
jgi:2-polyprenyl-3-methyl-5-hydroxy-6-metoxy-1,4-benzoquinol methylase